MRSSTPLRLVRASSVLALLAVATAPGCAAQEEPGSGLRADFTAITYNVQRPETESATIATDRAARAKATADTLYNAIGAAKNPAAVVFAQESYDEFGSAMVERGFQKVSAPLTARTDWSRSRQNYMDLYVDPNSTVQDNRYVAFSTQGGGLDRTRDSGMHIVRSQDLDGKSRILVGTHMPSFDSGARDVATTELLKTVADLRASHPQADIVIGGDFNAPTDAVGGVRDRFKQLGGLVTSDAAPTWDNDNRRAREGIAPGDTMRLDDLFVLPADPSATKMVSSGLIKNDAASDHYAVIGSIPDPDRAVTPGQQAGDVASSSSDVKGIGTPDVVAPSATVPSALPE